MSSNCTISEPHYDWIPSDDEEISSGAINVERRVSIVHVNRTGMLEQGVIRAIAQSVELPRTTIVKASMFGRPLGILSYSLASVLTDVDLASIRAIYGIPDSVELHIPNTNERADWDVPRWTCFYEYVFRLGFRFTISSLARPMLVYYDIAPGQLMPNGWRILLSLTVLRERYEINFGLGCLLHNYYLKKHISDKGRYMLILRSKDHQLIPDTTTNYRHWKDTFFFTRGPPIDGRWGFSIHISLYLEQIW
ncbi:hypothetical protein Ddye_020224 [Dipteronia dyeriana]|uniref:Uncharacterized protein n=1 Tax=Dipteronia dyeriana TaxID=168575 RepID=A0AAD9WV64_9ROSI|nr:hypothetical protein Ddye_020224 [Dipteronia dyeriana]